MNEALDDLIKPAMKAEFAALLRGRRPLFRRAEGGGRYAGLIGWPAVRAIVESGAVPPARLRVTRNNLLVRRSMYADGDKVNARRFGGLLAQGISVVVNGLEQHAPAVGALCGDIARRLGEAVTAIAIVTTGPGGAFGLHFDPRNVLVLHLEGSKRWRYYDTPAVLPPDAGAQPVPPGTPPVFDEVLEPGDLLFLPAGYWHHCENGPGLSMHLTIGIQHPVLPRVR